MVRREADQLGPPSAPLVVADQPVDDQGAHRVERFDRGHVDGETAGRAAIEAKHRAQPLEAVSMSRGPRAARLELETVAAHGGLQHWFGIQVRDLRREAGANASGSENGIAPAETMEIEAPQSCRLAGNMDSGGSVGWRN